MKSYHHLLACLLVLLSLWLGPTAACAQGSAFTYQGQINSDGAPVNGPTDFDFALYNAASGGAAVAAGLNFNDVPVSNGLFTVTLDFGAGAFDGSPRWLQMAVRPGASAGGFTNLSPRQPILATPHAIVAGKVTGPINGSSIVNGSITSAQLAAGAVTAANIASNSITASQLAPGAAAANLDAASQSPVASGGLVLSTRENGALLNAGYVRIGATTLADAWQERASGSSLGARWQHVAVWTGSEMIIWGGRNNSDTVYFNTGARYNPVANSWTEMGTNGAPIRRILHTAVWTGSEMIIWGGLTNGPSGLASANDGGRYNPAANTWTPVTTNGAPPGSAVHTAVWTGSQMLVWGGNTGAGARYSPGSDSWSAISSTGAPGDRDYHTAVWTGSEMIIWGGIKNSTTFSDGGRYNPLANSWTPVAPSGTPAARWSHTAVWTGNEMIIWGGWSGFSSGIYHPDGGRYNPALNSWTTMTTNGGPSARINHTAVWSGNEMIIWGGAFTDASGSNFRNDGGRYNPVTGTWTPVSTIGPPAARASHKAVWTGNEMIVWGGGAATNFGDGGRYNPTCNSWSPVGTSTAPVFRSNPSAVWTGSEMIVWGGQGNVALDEYINTGGRYDPVGNDWTVVTTLGAPSPRIHHTAVWTGQEMIIWGGFGSVSHNTGGRYSPVGNSWTTVSTTGAPTARSGHTAVWTGSEMIIWGGSSGSQLNTGGRYSPAGNSWTALPTSGAPSARSSHTAVWTGTEMIVWGGIVNTTYLGSGGRYNPAANSWTTVSTTGAPGARIGHETVWTGSEMIIWGGANASVSFNSGARYNPLGNSWTAMSTSGAPVARDFPTAVWTGTEMIVWGGRNGATPLRDGARYNPAGNSWTPVTIAGGPAARWGHTAVWSGSEMIIWGGTSAASADYTDTWSYSPGRVMYLYQRL